MSKDGSKRYGMSIEYSEKTVWRRTVKNIRDVWIEVIGEKSNKKYIEANAIKMRLPKNKLLG